MPPVWPPPPPLTPDQIAALVAGAKQLGVVLGTGYVAAASFAVGGTIAMGIEEICKEFEGKDQKSIWRVTGANCVRAAGATGAGYLTVAAAMGSIGVTSTVATVAIASAGIGAFVVLVGGLTYSIYRYYTRSQEYAMLKGMITDKKTVMDKKMLYSTIKDCKYIAPITAIQYLKDVNLKTSTCEQDFAKKNDILGRAEFNIHLANKIAESAKKPKKGGECTIL